MNIMKKVAMIGVGKLGQDCAEVMSQHYDVVGYDVEVRNPAFPMKDTIAGAVADRDLIFIAAPTPHDPIYGGETPTSHLPNKDFDYSIVINILNEVNKHVNSNQLVVLISTVLPGTVRRLLRPCISNARFIYNPYLIAMGTIKWDMVNPEMVIIGTEDGSLTGDAQELIDFYKVFMENNPRYEVGTWDEAESIKIFYNTFISTKLALVNMIQDVAEKNGNINVDVVTKALADSKYRIMGPAYMKAGLGDAGACHPRDNIALRWLADNLNLGYDLFDSIMTAREKQAEQMALRCLKNGKNITIVGKAYKPKVHYINGSASMLVGHYIEKHGGNLHYYDLNTGDNDLRKEWTDVYLIGYWEEWVEQIDFPQHSVVIDPWRKITPEHHSGEIIHYGDTRPKKKFKISEAHKTLIEGQLLELLPEFKLYFNHTHIIYAGINRDHTIVLRPTEDIVNELLEAIHNNKTIFVFDGNAEDIQPVIILKIHRILKLLDGKIKPEQFYCTIGADNLNNVYENICKNYDINDRINVVPLSFFEYTMKKRSGIFEYTGQYQIGPKAKKFLCFNKVPRKHRIYLFNEILKNNLYQQSYYSFEGEPDLNWIDQFKDCTHLQLYKHKFPIRLNITPDRTNPVDLAHDDLRFFDHSYFSLVTETVFYKSDINNESIFFSEKIWKPIILNHPFILVARPKSLKKLKEYGYKTFSPHIDERYDDIEDDDERLEFIVEEVKRLCSLDPLQLLLWQKEIKDIVEHNKKIFFARTNYCIDKNIKEKFIKSINTDIQKPVVLQQFQKSNEAEWIPVTSWEQAEKTALIQQDSNSPYLVTTNGLGIMCNQNDIGVVKLPCGYTIQFSRMLDGGGLDYVEELSNIINQYRKDKVYDHVLEWCAGFGVLGFELLGQGIANKLSFHEYFDQATKNLAENVISNNLANKVTIYNYSNIGSLPDVKFDLIVANPPHCWDFNDFLNTTKNNESCIPQSFINTARLCVDHEGLTHKEFFMNIKKHLTDDADIFLIENNDHQLLKDFADQNGLAHIHTYWMDNTGSKMLHGTIMHFKVKR